MAKKQLTTAIEWVLNSDGSRGYTFNPWIGCTKISPACNNFYAERDRSVSCLGVRWGVGQPRHRTSESYWKQPLKWNKEAQKKVFVFGYFVQAWQMFLIMK